MIATTTEILALPAFNDNYIWLIRRGGRAIVVDPGDADPVLSHLTASGDKLCAVLLTHHHPDHVGGVAKILATATAHSAEALSVYGPAAENIACVTHPLEGGERISIASLSANFDVINVPGHTRGHIAYYDPTLIPDGALFCGDTLFGGGCGRLFEGSPAQMHSSLARLAVLPAPTFVYCAHEYTQSNLRFACAVEPTNMKLRARCEEVDRARAGNRATIPTRIGVELATNPFLRCDVPEVIAAAGSRLGREPIDKVQVFAAIREWKNNF